MKLNQLAINYARSIAAETICKAKSGHTGTSVGAATIFYSLFKDHYFFDVDNHNFLNRDRFVVSAGHSSALYYTMLHMFDMGISIEDLKDFRRLGSNTPGHPEVNDTAFVETSTGPLGQGVANAVGMAIAESMAAEKFNVQKFQVVKNYTYCFVGDGCLMEGVAQEAISLAGNLNLNRLILLYDSNNITIDGKVELANTENIVKKFKAMNWNVIKVRNGNNYFFVTNAIARAKRSKKPTIIIFNTKIGYGTDYEGQNKIHGKPLTLLELEQYKIKLGVQGSFYIPDEIMNNCYRTVRKNKIQKEKWEKSLVLYERTHPDLFKQFMAYWEDKSIDIEKHLNKFLKDGNLSGREANKVLLNFIASKSPRFVGGTADVGVSTMCVLDEELYGDYSKFSRRGRNIHFGVREHAMGSICNGISLYNQAPCFCSTFLTFSNYLIPSIRMSASMDLPVFYCFTHDSFRVGQDGPSHQPVEQISQLRAIPHLKVFRPCDIKELSASYKLAVDHNYPSAFILSKHTLVEQNGDFDKMLKGGYILESVENPDVVIYATGADVEVAIQTKEKLEKDGLKVSVCSFPCLEIFNNQTDKYKNSVLQYDAKLRVVIEPTNDTIWYKYLKDNDMLLNFTTFGKCGKTDELEKFFNFNAQAFCKKIKNHLTKMNKKN